MASPASYRPRTGEIPTEPGVYRFRDQHGRVIYVGKASNLRSRLSSYFQDLSALHPRYEAVKRETVLAELGPTLLDLALSLPVMDSARIRTELGWAPRHTGRDALADAIDRVDGAVIVDLG